MRTFDRLMLTSMLSLIFLGVLWLAGSSAEVYVTGGICGAAAVAVWVVK